MVKATILLVVKQDFTNHFGLIEKSCAKQCNIWSFPAISTWQCTCTDFPTPPITVAKSHWTQVAPSYLHRAFKNATVFKNAPRALTKTGIITWLLQCKICYRCCCFFTPEYLKLLNGICRLVKNHLQADYILLQIKI